MMRVLLQEAPQVPNPPTIAAWQVAALLGSIALVVLGGGFRW